MFGFFFQASCVYRMRTWRRNVWQPWPGNWRPPLTSPSGTTSSSFSVTSVLGKTLLIHIFQLSKLRYFHTNKEKPTLWIECKFYVLWLKNFSPTFSYLVISIYSTCYWNVIPLINHIHLRYMTLDIIFFNFTNFE